MGRILGTLFIVFISIFGLRFCAEESFHVAADSFCEQAKGHNCAYVKPPSIKEQLRGLRAECAVYGKVWCEKNWKRGVADIYRRAEMDK